MHFFRLFCTVIHSSSFPFSLLLFYRICFALSSTCPAFATLHLHVRNLDPLCFSVCISFTFFPLANFVSHSSLSFHTFSHISSLILHTSLHHLFLFLNYIPTIFFCCHSLTLLYFTLYLVLPFWLCSFIISLSLSWILSFTLPLSFIFFLILLSQIHLSASSYVSFSLSTSLSLSFVFFPCCVLMQNGMFYTSYVSTYLCLVRLNELLSNFYYVLPASLLLFFLLISFCVTSCIFCFALEHLSIKNYIFFFSISTNNPLTSVLQS